MRFSHRSRTHNYEKNAIQQERAQRTRTGNNRKLKLLQVIDKDGEFPELFLGYLEEVSKVKIN